MTLKNALDRFDSQYRNSVPEELKLGWLTDLDYGVYINILATREGCKINSFGGYNQDTDKETVLLIPDPFSKIYTDYLAMRSDLYYGDIARYNNDLYLYSSAYGEFENYMCRNYLPVKKVDRFKI